MLMIRLARRGARHRPFYDVVVTEKQSPRDGRFVEKVGYHNPIAQGKEIPTSFKIVRLDYWLKCGAQPSERVGRLIKDYKKSTQQDAQTT